MPQLVSDLKLPYLDTIGLERREAIDAIAAARSVHWLARTELGYSVTRLAGRHGHPARPALPLGAVHDRAGARAPGLERARRAASSPSSPWRARATPACAAWWRPAFTPASANRLRPTMRRVVGELVDRVGRAAASASWWPTSASPTRSRSSASCSARRPRTGSCSRPGRPTSSASSTTTWPRTCRSSSRPARS